MPNIYQQFSQIAQANLNKTALAYVRNKKYQKISYKQLDNFRLQIAYFLQKFALKTGDKIGVLLNNSPEWVISDLACATIGVINVPLHTTYNPEQIKKIIQHAELKYLIIQDEYWNQHQALWQAFAWEKIIIVGNGHENKNNISPWPKLEYQYSLAELDLEIDENKPHTIIYTSGTTGDPKGVVLSHKNLVSDVMSAKRMVAITNTDRFFSFLPLSHAFERTAGYYAAIFSGASIYFARSQKTILEDIKSAHPTILTAVPRIFERIYDKIFDNIRSGSEFKKKIFFNALNLAKAKKKNTLNFWQKILFYFLDLIVFKKIRHILGGNLRMAISGGASLNQAIAKFFASFGVLVIEGYGLTETSPIVAVNQIADHKFGTVGKVLDCNQIIINSDKEILIKGDNLMLEYYKNSEATHEAIDTDGWFHTGDLGFIDEDGFLIIIGRAKDMIVLSTGKNIFPEPIESKINENKYISQSFVYGDKQKNISALLVPDFKELEKWCKEQDLVYVLPNILYNSKVLVLYQAELDKQLSALSHLEKINNFLLINEEFSQENGLLTPSLKLRRRNIKDKYLG